MIKPEEKLKEVMSIPGLESIIEPVIEYLPLVRQKVVEAIPSDRKLAPLKSPAEHLLNKDGKYLRPALVLLSCGLCGEEPEQAIDYAAIMEILHIGSLVFDDVLDDSKLRRGRKTINFLWDEKTAFLTGTHLLLELASRMAFENKLIRKVLIDTLNSMFRGEVLQFQSKENFDLGEDIYMDIIEGKSASAMSGCCRIGALAAGDTSREPLMAKFGIELGTAFQIRDDVLDLFADPAKLGKELGSDLRDARMTLPLIYSANNSSRSDRRYLKSVFGLNGGRKVDLNRVNEIIRKTGSFSFCMDKARGLVLQAISKLDEFEDSRYKTALETFCRFAVERDY